MVVDGIMIAKEILAGLTPKIAALPERKFFGAAVVGDDPASLNFLKQKEKAAKELGVDFRLYKLPFKITSDELRREIGRLAAPSRCGAITLQLPLPAHINKRYVLNAIPEEKDVDLLGERAREAFFSGGGAVLPPSVGTVKEILGRVAFPLRPAHVVILGKGFLVGEPVGFWLSDKVAELKVFRSADRERDAELKDADLVVSGAGEPKLVSPRELKDNALVIDFGTSEREGKIVGDFDPSGAEEKNITYTPTPGGTGPILVAKLFENFYALHQK